MRRVLVAVASIALATSASLVAQERLPPLAPGQRVRVTAPQHGFQRTAATLLDIRSDTLYVLRVQARSIRGRVVSWDSLTSAVPVAAIERLDVSRGRRSRWLQGLGIGMAVGGATGALIGLASGDDEGGFSAGDNAAIAGIGLGVVGGVVGVLVGAVSRGDRWQEVPRHGLLVSLAPTRNGVLLGASIAF